MPLVQSLDLLKRRVESPLFRTLLEDVHEKVRSGTALSDAFASHGDLFPRVYTASLLAGERSGSLDTVLRRYVEYAKIIATLRRKTISALIYPMILITLALGLVSLIILKIVPAFSEFYTSYGAELPVFTRILVAVSDFINSRLVFILLSVAAGVAAVFLWIRQPGKRAQLDRWRLRVPLVGPIAAKFATSQMA